MSKEDRKELFRWVLLIFGFLFIFFTLLLYLGDDYMKRSCVIKIICVIVLGLAFVGGIIAMCACDTDEKYPPLYLCKKPGKLIYAYNSGFAIVRGTKESYVIKHFDSLKSTFSEIKDGDTLYIFDSELQLSQKEFNELFNKQVKIKSLSIKFADTDNKIFLNN